MAIHLSEHFGYRKLFRFTLPSLVMMVFTGIYGAVDGVFVANFTTPAHFAAVNLIYPVLYLLSAFGFMVGAGGSALISKTLGEGDSKKANETFSFLIYFSLALSAVIAVAGICLLRPIARLLTSDIPTQDYCVTYGTIFLCALPAAILQFEFISLFVTAEKPKLGLILSLSAGLTNILLDALFIIVFQWGVAGAAAATACGYLVGGAIPLLYFSRKNSSPLRLGKARWDFRALVKTCTNGFSEFMTNISVSLVTILYNFQLQKLAGVLGINAYAAISCVGFIFLSIFLGYATGVAPVVGYHFGAKNKEELHGLLKRSLVVVAACSFLLFVSSLALASPLALLYSNGDQAMHEMTVRGFSLYCFSYLLAGFNIFASSFFTALNDGGVSAIISFLRTFCLQVLFVFLLPVFWGLDGIWLAALFAELGCLIASFLFIVFKRKKYGY